jgi:hypothetical protein
MGIVTPTREQPHLCSYTATPGNNYTYVGTTTPIRERPHQCGKNYTYEGTTTHMWEQLYERDMTTPTEYATPKGRAPTLQSTASPTRYTYTCLELLAHMTSDGTKIRHQQ